MSWCKNIYTIWKKASTQKTPTWKKLVAKCNLQETLVKEIFASLGKENWQLSADLEEFLKCCSASWGSTGLVEDCFQRLRTGEANTPTKGLSGLQAWSVPIEKSVLSDVYNFQELQGDECPTLTVDDPLVSDSFFHVRRREASMDEFLS